MAAVNLPIYKSSNGAWKLTLAERKRILLNNIYGVDIDQQAVEVTKLSLLLKVLEDESGEEVQTLKRWSAGERALPDLSNNIKCGNSLVDTDIELNDIVYGLIRPFNWETEFSRDHGCWWFSYNHRQSAVRQAGDSWQYQGLFRNSL